MSWTRIIAWLRRLFSERADIGGDPYSDRRQ
jgi:hypothetical protein